MSLLLVFGTVIVAVLSVVAVFRKKLRRRLNRQTKTSARETGLNEKLTSDFKRSGYRYAEDQPAFFFIKDNGVWTGVVLDSSTDEFDTLPEQERSVAESSAMYSSILDYFVAKKDETVMVPCHELVRYQPVDTDEWLKSYQDRAWDPSGLFRTLVEGKVNPHISESAPERQRYLLVRLGDQKAPVDIDVASKLLNADEGLVKELFSKHELTHYRRLAGEVLDRLSPWGVPMTRSDLSWLIRKPLAGHFQPRIDRDYERTRWSRNGWFDELTDFRGTNLKGQAAVKIEEPYPTTETPKYSYTTTLVIKSSEHEHVFGYEQAWGRVLRSLPRPVEVSWRFALVGEKQWAKKLIKAAVGIENETQDRNKAGTGIAVTDNKFGHRAAMAEGVKQDLEIRARPGLIGQLRLCISAPTLEELTKAEQDVRDAMRDVKLERKKTIQYQLLEEQLPGDVSRVNIGDLVISKETGGLSVGTRYTDLEILGFARLDSSPTVGDDTHFSTGGDELGWHGHAIGYATENGSIVHFDPFVQIARNSGAGIAIIGASGGGKSTLALCLFFWVSESGVQSVVLDPKNDFEAFVHYMAFGSQVLDDGFRDAADRGELGEPGSPFQPINEHFWRDTRVVSLTHSKSGVLDPWALCGNYQDGEELARQQVEQLFAGADKETRNALDGAFTKLRDSYLTEVEGDPNAQLPRLSHLSSFLGEDIEFYQEIARNSDDDGAKISAKMALDGITSVRNRLDRAQTQPYSRLLFGQAGQTDAIRGFTHRRTIITMIGFTPPKSEDTSGWSETTRNAAAAMFTVLFQVERVFEDVEPTVSPNSRTKGVRPRILFVDEAYMVTAFPAGASLLNRGLRQGRSLYFAVVIICQQAKDINKIENAFKDEDEADQNQFGTVFVFQQKGPAEARAAVKLLRNSAQLRDEELNSLSVRLLNHEVPGGTLSTGVCVMRDNDSRVGTVSVDPLLRELFAATQTNATQRPKYQSVDPPQFGSEWHLDPSIRDRTRRGMVAEIIAEYQEARADEPEFEMDEYLTDDVLENTY